MHPIIHHNPINRAFSVAPMLDWTDRHCRYFYRLLSKRALLYTEMVTTGALIHGDKERFLYFNPEENPVAFQLGGSVPEDLALCAQWVEQAGYDEVNLNVGCPSDRVQNGMFGACLMAKPELVGDCIAAMKSTVSIPVTVKCRIGIDDLDAYSDLVRFIDIVSNAGCGIFIIHARKAWLQGLSPKQNRDIPPLRYEVVYQIKRDFPQLEIIINGGITDLKQATQHLEYVDGVMLGREVYHHPYILAQVDSRFYNMPSQYLSRQEVVMNLIPYIQKQLSQGLKLNNISRHILGLFHGQKGAKAWRRYISENAHKPGADERVILEALKFTQ